MEKQLNRDSDVIIIDKDDFRSKISQKSNLTNFGEDYSQVLAENVCD